MKIKRSVLGMAFVLVSFIACKTTDTIETNEKIDYSEIIVYDSADSGGNFDIYIDGEFRGKIDSGRKTNFITPNGQHKIYVVRNGFFTERSDEVLFNAVENQLIFKISRAGIIFTKTILELEAIKSLSITTGS